MRRLLSLLILGVAASVLCAASATASVSYPQFATPDGATTTADVPNAVAVNPPLTVPSYIVEETAAAPVAATASPSGNFKHTFWGNEAGFPTSRILQYTIIPGVVPGPVCVPAHGAGSPVQQNGRGIAFDPLDGNLWNTTVALFAGDGFIHKNTPPPACTPVTDLPFGDGPGGTVQDDIGALDVDEGTKHIWAAGYQPVSTGGPLLSYIYKVNRNNGKIINSCAIPFRGGGVGNDTLAVYRNPSLPGSAKYLVTDAGEFATTPFSYAVIDQSDCHKGQVVTPVLEVQKSIFEASGIDIEWPGFLVSNLTQLFNRGDFPFATPVLVGTYGNTTSMEDVSLCGFRGAVGGDGNDMCPYP